MSIKKDFISGFIKGTGIFAAIISFGIIGVFAANWYDSFTATTGEQLTITKWNNMNKYLVPTGMIAAFDRACPSPEWSEYIPARGRFLRGIDPTGSTVDPAGTRAIGNLQIDTIQDHTHYTYGNTASSPAGNSLMDKNNGNNGGNGYTTSFPVSGNHGVETRPKNVAVIFCIKN